MRSNSHKTLNCIKVSRCRCCYFLLLLFFYTRRLVVLPFFLRLRVVRWVRVTLSAFSSDGEMVHEVFNILNRGPWMPTFYLWPFALWRAIVLLSVEFSAITTDCPPIRQVARVSSWGRNICHLFPRRWLKVYSKFITKLRCRSTFSAMKCNW